MADKSDSTMDSIDQTKRPSNMNRNFLNSNQNSETSINSAVNITRPVEKKKPVRKVLEGSARELVLNMIKFCEAEKDEKALLIPLSNVRRRVAALAGISEKTIARIVKEGKIAEATKSRLVTPGKNRLPRKKQIRDKVDMDYIKQKITEYYTISKELPSVNKMRMDFQNDINYQGSNSTLRRILSEMGIKLKPPNGKPKKINKIINQKCAWEIPMSEHMHVVSDMSMQDLHMQDMNLIPVNNMHQITNVRSIEMF